MRLITAIKQLKLNKKFRVLCSVELYAFTQEFTVQTLPYYICMQYEMEQTFNAD